LDIRDHGADHFDAGQIGRSAAEFLRLMESVVGGYVVSPIPGALPKQPTF
jgi:hypothetical protein